LDNFFETPPATQKNPFEGLCVIYVLYFDEERGHIPLLIYPKETEKLKSNKKFMRPIKYHSIWFLDIDEEGALDHIDLEYKGYTFFGKKLYTKSERVKRRAGLEVETPETIVIIVALPNDLEIFGDELIQIMDKKVRENFEDQLYKIIESEIAQEEIIKTPKIREIIKEGTKVKVLLRDLIDKAYKEYFARTIKHSNDTSIKKQKAISCLMLNGFDFSHITGGGGESEFSNIKLFDPNKQSSETFTIKNPFSISNIILIEDSQEIEILVHNNTEKEFNNVTIKITHVKEFFEKEIMNQIIDMWFPEEELMFISPIIPHINEYLFFIIEEENKEKLLSKKIDLNLLNRKKS
jgi:hypothetical protein